VGVEQSPELARQLLQARNRLIDPSMVIERELGVLLLPDAAKWGMNTTPPQPTTIDLRQRLLTEALLYSLLEDELSS